MEISCHILGSFGSTLRIPTLSLLPTRREGRTPLAHDVGAGTWRNLSFLSHRAALRGLGRGDFTWILSGNSAATPTVRSSSKVWPVDSRIASFPVYCCQRRMATST